MIKGFVTITLSFQLVNPSYKCVEAQRGLDIKK